MSAWARRARGARARLGLSLLVGLALAASGVSAGAGVQSAGEGATGTKEGRGVAGEGATGTKEGRGVKASSPQRAGSIVIDHERLVAFAVDADSEALHRVDLLSGAVSTTPLECAPEQAVLLGEGRLAVSLRGCSKVALIEVDEAGDAVVIATRDVPADPWGLAVTPRGEVLVTSAWGRAVTALGASALDVRWSVQVDREPRSISVSPDGARAFVTHLVGDAITILDLDEGAARGGPPPARRLRALGGASTYKNRVDRAIGATPLRPTSALAYASVLSESGSRLFVPHVVEQNGSASATSVPSPGSYGGVAVEQDTSSSSVAVIATWGAPREASVAAAGSEAPSRYGERVLGAAPQPKPGPVNAAKQPIDLSGAQPFDPPDPIDRKALISIDFFGPVVVGPASSPSRQARAAAVLGGSLFVASLGTNELVELDARALDPAMTVLRAFSVGEGPTGVDVDARTGIAVTWNQLSHDVSVISLGSGAVETIPVAADPLDPAVSAGRRLFFTERDRRISRDGRSCAGCHPDGRDDGVVWMLGAGPRQTPTLIGRAERGPFGWLGKHTKLEDNMSETMSRLGGTGLPPEHLAELAAFVRSLPAPHRGSSTPTTADTLSPEAARGRELFASREVGCGGCHTLEREASDRRLHDVASRAKTDESKVFRTPPLLYLADTAPYFHDGRYATLEQLLADNLDRMGSTTHLSDADLAALAAFLRTL